MQVMSLELPYISVGKGSASNEGDSGLIPELEINLEKRKWQPYKRSFKVPCGQRELQRGYHNVESQMGSIAN